MKTLEQLLEDSSALHRHLCPRQVLGVRMGVWAGELLGLELPQGDKRLLTIVETDGCFTDGVSAATNCWVGRRTMRVEDFGKVAATFVDTVTRTTIRIAPRLDVRQRARDYAPEARNQWEAQLLGYQRMPAGELLSAHSVRLNTPIERIASRPGVKTLCDVCGEEIMNEREIVRHGATLCCACAGQGYYLLMGVDPQPHTAATVDTPRLLEFTLAHSGR
jgi:formylmethanofuran dehydrogenase subunit E